MKKKVFWSILTVIAAIIVIRGFFHRPEPSRHPPGVLGQGTEDKRSYTQQDRKQILRVLIARNPELWRKRYILGGLYLQEGDFDRAAEQFKEIIKIQPGMIQAYNALGICRLNQGKNGEAAAAWKKVLEIDPGNAQAKDLIARIETAEERAKKRRGLETLLKENPDRPRAWFLAGEIYLQEKLYDRAIAALEKATRLDPGRAEYFYRLGYAYHRTGDYARAETALETARTLDPGNDAVETLLRDARSKKAK